MRAFAYHAPSSLAEAVAVLEREGPGGRILAGGTDLLVQAKERGSVPRYVVSLRDVHELSRVSFDEAGGLEIGARVSLGEVADHPEIRRRFSAISTGASLVGSYQIQNRGTVGGNLCNAAPSADCAPPLLVLDAVIDVHGATGRREIPLVDFFVGPGRTVLGADEVLVSIRVPSPPSKSGSAYLRHTPRQEMDIAVVGVAASVALDARGDVASLRVALGAVGPTPFLAREAGARAVGQAPDDATIAEVARIAAGEARPISDQRGSAAWRRHLVEVLARRAIKIAIGRALAA